jgi:hypothetical protein
MTRDRSRKDHPDYRRGYRDGRLYGTGHNHGRAAAGGKPPRGCLRRLLLLPLLIPLALARHRHQSGPLGRRRDDPRHAAGDWHTDRGDLPPDHQNGGPRKPLRTNLEEPSR